MPGNKRSDIGKAHDKHSETKGEGRRPEGRLERREEPRNKRMELSSRQHIEKALTRCREGHGNYAEREKKAEIVEGVVTKHYPVNEAKRVDNSRDFHFQDDREYNRELRRRDPEIGDDAQRVAGYHDSRDNQAFVREQGQTLETSVHEKLHQKSMSEMPTRLNEGITEYFTRQTTGEVGRLKDIDNRGREISKSVSDYEREREIIGKISATIGDAPLRSAYFDGRTNVLQTQMDRSFGQGSYQELARALEERNYDRAEAILHRGMDNPG